MGRRRNKRKATGEAQAPVLPLDPPKPRGPGGQPTKCTPETTRLVVEAILKGAGREDAAEAACVSVRALALWLEKGRAQEAPEYVQFLQAVEGAERQLVLKCSAGMVDLTEENVPPAVRFAALKLILQSRRPTVWRPAKEIALSAPGGGPVQVEHGTAPLVTPEMLALLTDEQLEALGRGLKS